MKVKTTKLIGPALDWAVAKCEGKPYSATMTTNGIGMEFPATNYSTCWTQGGPIIEREFIELRNRTSFSGGWEAWKWLDENQDYLIVGKQGHYCSTPLIAAMRCLVASKLGDEVEVPEELL